MDVEPREPTTTAAIDIDLLRQVTAATADIFTAPGQRAAANIYLRQRGINTKSLAPDWLLGYAPPGWTRLVDKLRGQFDDQALIEAGVARRSSRGTLIDTFRDRVIFGIRSADGRVAGFIGRDLSGDPNGPKYLNTRQHPLFDKGALLYGLHEGIQNRDAHQPVVVEGPLDVLALAARQRASGSSTGLLPVAPCGTAFTVTHARRVAEIAFTHRSPVVVAMDADPAGRAAALTAGENLRYAGLEVRVAVMANGLDPADYLTRSDANLETFRADTALPLIALQAQKAIADQGDRMQWIEGRLAAARTIARYLATYPAGYTARQIGWLANALNLDASTITFELTDAYRSAPASRPRHVNEDELAPGLQTLDR